MDRPLGLDGLDDQEDAEDSLLDGGERVAKGRQRDVPAPLHSLQKTMLLITLGAVFIAVLAAIGVFVALGASGSVAIFGGILSFFVTKILVILIANVIIVRVLLDRVA